MGRKPKLTPHQKREAIRRRDKGEDSLPEIGRGYNVSGWTRGHRHDRAIPGECGGCDRERLVRMGHGDATVCDSFSLLDGHSAGGLAGRFTAR
jgi:hypothetical protein